LFIVVAVVLLAVLCAEAYLLLRSRRTGGVWRPAEARAAMGRGPKKAETLGDPSAPVQVKLWAPLTLEWHQKTIALLREYESENPGRIHAEFMPMGAAECDTEMQNLGYVCATLLVNGENEFTLPDGREVTLTKRPNESYSFYNSADVITIIEQLRAGPRSGGKVGGD
jgi:hypothetical protein